MTPRTICLKAARFLNKKRFVKDEYDTGDGGYCAVGALKATFKGNFLALEHIRRVATLVYGHDIESYNDTVTTTKKQVIQRLRDLARLV